MLTANAIGKEAKVLFVKLFKTQVLLLKFVAYIDGVEKM